MILVLIESTYAFTVNNKNLVGRLTTMLFNFDWFCPNPETLCARIYGRTNTKSTLISFVKYDSVQ